MHPFKVEGILATAPGGDDATLRFSALTLLYHLYSNESRHRFHNCLLVCFGVLYWVCVESSIHFLNRDFGHAIHVVGEQTSEVVVGPC